MAGAEGIEPSARGFGVDVGNTLHRKAFRTFQPLASFRLFASLPFDAFLMLFACETCFPNWIVRDIKAVGQSVPGCSNFTPEETKNRDLKQ